mmetsp:Transcript_7411/g.20803  ORF Transcript_7411/g.20803 Transcript_7411/m.20803 type:complete len:233 (-) Transcript_7411:733-1431(-)
MQQQIVCTSAQTRLLGLRVVAAVLCASSLWLSSTRASSWSRWITCPRAAGRGLHSGCLVKTQPMSGLRGVSLTSSRACTLLPVLIRRSTPPRGATSRRSRPTGIRARRSLQTTATSLPRDKTEIRAAPRGALRTPSAPASTSRAAAPTRPNGTQLASRSALGSGRRAPSRRTSRRSGRSRSCGRLPFLPSRWHRLCVQRVTFRTCALSLTSRSAVIWEILLTSSFAQQKLPG